LKIKFITTKPCLIKGLGRRSIYDRNRCIFGEGFAPFANQ